MRKLTKGINWRRMTFEGFVIIVSILLAFAIDAWWDGHKQQQSEQERLARVVLELRANSDFVNSKIKTLESAISATDKFLSWMGPEPAMVDANVFTDTWGDAMSIGTFSLVRPAANDFLAAGEVTPDRGTDLRNALFGWSAHGDTLEKHYELLREAHSRVFEYLLAAYPIYHLSSDNDAMAGHPLSKFPYDDSLILADPLAENIFGIYLIRLEFVTRRAARFSDEQAEVLALIESRLKN